MFDFLNMANNYEQRKVARYEDKQTGLVIDTCAVTDSDHPYETGVKHPAYGNGDWIIVAMYNSNEAAVQGHKDWVAKMTAETLPAVLEDVGTSEIAKLSNLIGNVMVYEKKSTDNKE